MRHPEERQAEGGPRGDLPEGLAAFAPRSFRPARNRVRYRGHERSCGRLFRLDARRFQPPRQRSSVVSSDCEWLSWACFQQDWALKGSGLVSESINAVLGMYSQGMTKLECAEPAGREGKTVKIGGVSGSSFPLLFPSCHSQVNLVFASCLS